MQAHYPLYYQGGRWFMVFNVAFNNISVLLVEETGAPRENHRPYYIYIYIHVYNSSH